MSFLTVQQVRKRFGQTVVLDGVSFAVERGETLVLLGPSGSGKTTLLRMIAGMETPDDGRLLLDGAEFTRTPPARRRFGMVFQHYALFPHLTVGENVGFGLEGRQAAGARVAEVLERVRLGGFADRRVHEISGGQQQRVAVARALAPNPRVMLLDEPLSNLDPNLREGTRRELKRTIDDLGMTALWVTHEQEEAFEVGDRVALLDQGYLQQIGTPEELYEQPSSLFVAAFVGKASWVSGEATAEGVRIAFGAGERDSVSWPARKADGVKGGDAVVAVFRPESLRLVNAAASQGASPALGRVEGTVTERRFAGASTLFRVRFAVGGELEVAGRSDAALVGDTVAIEPIVEAPLPSLFPRSEMPTI